MVKKIVIVTPYFAPAWAYGGPPKVLYVLSLELIKLGKRVTVVTTDALDYRRNNVARESINKIKIMRFKTLSNDLCYKTKICFVPGLLQKIRTELDNADIVLFSETRTMHNWQLYSYLLSIDKPYGIFAFGTIPQAFDIKSMVKRVLDWVWVSRFIKEASFRFAQTGHEQQMYGEYFDVPIKKTHLLPLPINKIKKSFHARRSSLLDNIKKSDRMLLFVGRLHYLKGIDILIESVKHLMEKDKNIKLIIVGRDDGEEKELKEMAPESLINRIIFTGPIYEPDIYDYYRQAKCFIFTPRFYEETSLACLEALSFGLPVVVTKESELPYLEEYQAGFMVENNPEMIQKAVSEILYCTLQQRKAYRKNAVKLICDHYRADQIANKLVSIMDDKF